MKFKLSKIFVWILSILVFIALFIYTAFKVSPWPSVLLIRYGFQRGGQAANEKIARYVPPGIVSIIDLPYDASDSKGAVDLYQPASTG